MMNWSQKRQLTISASICLLVVIIVSFFLGKRHIEKPQTCFDGLLNQNEKGIDCGLVCNNICKEDEKAPTLMWTRLLPARDNYWNLIFALTNKEDIKTSQLTYHAKIFDETGTLIKEIDGKLPVLPKKDIVWMHEIPFETGKRIPNNAQITFEKAPWQYVTQEESTIQIFIKNIKLTTKQSKSSVSGELYNQSAFIVPKVTLVCLAISKQDTVIFAQKTQENNIVPYENRDVACVWPQNISQELISRVEIVSNFNLSEYKKP